MDFIKALGFTVLVMIGIGVFIAIVSNNSQ